jgi:uncharacterized membrane protein
VGNKILVSVFDSERTAFEGLTALKDLHRDGDVTLYASTVIAKDASGTVSVRQAADRGPIGTLVGIVTGGLVGLLGGPAGVAVGAYVGGFGGLMYDLFKAGVSMDFVDEVSASLIPGTAAVVADIDEMWVTPIDTRLGALGGTTFRRLPGEVIDTELIRETDAARAELEQLRAELAATTGEAKAKVEASIEAQRRKLEALDERLGKAIDQQEAEFRRGSPRCGAAGQGARASGTDRHPHGRAEGVARGAQGEAPRPAGSRRSPSRPRARRSCPDRGERRGPPVLEPPVAPPFIRDGASHPHGAAAKSAADGLPDQAGRIDRIV